MVPNDGCVELSSKENGKSRAWTVPVSFEVVRARLYSYQTKLYHLVDQDNRDKKIAGQVLAQLFGSILDSNVDAEKEVCPSVRF